MIFFSSYSVIVYVIPERISTNKDETQMRSRRRQGKSYIIEVCGFAFECIVYPGQYGCGAIYMRVFHTSALLGMLGWCSTFVFDVPYSLRYPLDVCVSGNRPIAFCDSCVCTVYVCVECIWLMPNCFSYNRTDWDSLFVSTSFGLVRLESVIC